MNETLIQTLVRILPADYSVRGVHADLMAAGVRALGADTDAILFRRILEANAK